MSTVEIAELGGLGEVQVQTAVLDEVQVQASELSEVQVQVIELNEVQVQVQAIELGGVEVQTIEANEIQTIELSESTGVQVQTIELSEVQVQTIELAVPGPQGPPGLSSPTASLVRIDVNSILNTIYVGKAPSGTLENTPGWVIQRTVFTPLGIKLGQTLSAAGVWADRVSLTYA